MLTRCLITLFRVVVMFQSLYTFTRAQVSGDRYRKFATASMLQTTFQTETGVSRIACCAACSDRSECESLSFKSSSQECQLSSVQFIHVTSDSVTSAEWNVYIKMGDCGDAPSVANAVFGLDSYPTLVRSYVCIDNSILVGTAPIVQCQLASRQWTPVTFECRKPSTCAEVQQCGPGYTTDEYFWLRPTAPGYDNLVAVKVYCHGMTVGAPVEFISVKPGTNYGNYPGGTWDTSKSVTFNKVKLNPTDMSLIREDTTFATYAYPYGQAGGCDCYYTCYDTPKGDFHIDSTGTGLRFDPTVEWQPNGWASTMREFSRNDANTTISAKCDGFCGHCYPTGPLYMLPNDLDDEVGEATFPICA